MNPRERLILNLKTLERPAYDRPRPRVSLEEFFTGNNDLGSMGCNLAKHPGLEVFDRVLRASPLTHPT